MPSEAYIPGPTSRAGADSDPHQPIAALAYRDAAQSWANDPGTLPHIAYTYGVLSTGTPFPENPNDFRGRDEAQRWLNFILETDENGRLPGLEAYGNMILGLAYKEQADREAARVDVFGMPNRMAIFEELERAIRWAAEEPQEAKVLPDGTKVPAEQQRGLGVAVLDMDYFKDINDTFGHPFGDIILGRLCDKLKSIVRSGEGFVGRLGGDEFILIFRLHEQTKPPKGRRGKEARSLDAVFAGVSSRIENEFGQEVELINQEIKAERERINAQRQEDNLSKSVEDQLELLSEVPDLKASFGWQLAAKKDSEATLVDKADRTMYKNKRQSKAGEAEQDRATLSREELAQLKRVIGLIYEKGLVRYYRAAEMLMELLGLERQQF